MKMTKQEKAWILYDCGNSAYSIAITTALLPAIFAMFKNVESSMDLGYFNTIASVIVAILIYFRHKNFTASMILLRLHIRAVSE